MCGRWTLSDISKLAARFDVEASAVKPRFNIAPTQQAFIVPEPHKLAAQKWSLSLGKFTVINTRAESISKPIYSAAKPCLVPADGFYEWKPAGSSKVPYRITLKSGELFAFAGLHDGNGFSIITVEPNDTVSKIHSRMPAILLREDEIGWLTGRNVEVLKPYAGELKAYQVSPLVNNVRNDSRELIQPA